MSGVRISSSPLRIYPFRESRTAVGHRTYGKESRPVLVVGAGPTGLTAATELARFGVPVRLIDTSAMRRRRILRARSSCSREPWIVLRAQSETEQILREHLARAGIHLEHTTELVADFLRRRFRTHSWSGRRPTVLPVGGADLSQLLQLPACAAFCTTRSILHPSASLVQMLGVATVAVVRPDGYVLCVGSAQLVSRALTRFLDRWMTTAVA